VRYKATQEVKLSQITKHPGKYSQAKRLEAAGIYAIEGSYLETERQTGISDTAIKRWSDAEWFQTRVAEVYAEIALEQRVGFSKIVDKAQEITMSKLDEASAAQANLIACQAIDKVRLHDNKPTMISSSQGTNEALKAVLDQCAAVANTLKDKRINSIKGECTEISVDGANTKANSGTKKPKPTNKPAQECDT